MKKLKRVKRKWTVKSRITSAIRKVWRWSPLRSEALNKARVKTKTGFKFRCVVTKKLYDRKLVTIDHKKPVVVPEQGFETWDKFIDRMFCPSNDLQVMSKVEHSKKTKLENVLRRKARNKK